MNKHDLFTRLTAQKKLDRIEHRLKIAEVICEEIKNAPDFDHYHYPYKDNVVGTIYALKLNGVNSILNNISSLLSDMTIEIQIDLHDLKECLHHMNALPIRNKKGELE